MRGRGQNGLEGGWRAAILRQGVDRRGVLPEGWVAGRRV